MLNIFIYLYFRIKKINNNDNNFSISPLFSAILFVHLMPLLLILSEFFSNYVSANLVKNIQEIMFVILLIPTSLIMYLYLRSNNERILEGMKKLEQMSKHEKRRKNFYLWLYIIGSFVFFFLGITSSDWVPWLKKYFSQIG